jgi:putative transcriptional regulator
MLHSLRKVPKKHEKKLSKIRFFVVILHQTKMYKTIDIDRNNLTLMGVKFSDLKTLESAANAIGTNMFEGFEPTKELIQLCVDWKTGIISETDFLANLYTIYGK